MGADTAISIVDVRKRFGSVEAVKGVTFDIREGEFFTMLGPSGCGKTTTLRMIAGFEEPDEGTILLRDQDVTHEPPNRRNVNMVFQHYALFPHMTVAENVAFGLRLKKVSKVERRKRVADILGVVQLEGREKRKPAQLSGGQQQRVALARALVNGPAALLLDEPLGALDVKLRKQLQLELKRVQAELGTTFVYVTHDQDEALAMSDRIAVMNDGVVDQIGSAPEVYEHPTTAFVADFIGSLNAFDLRVDSLEGTVAAMHLGEGGRALVEAGATAAVGGVLRVAVRPERVRLSPAGDRAPEGGSRVQGTVAQIVYLGSLTQFHVDTDVGRIVVVRMNDEDVAELPSGTRVLLSWPVEHASVLAGAPVAAQA
jgi:spermidine/putrescine transport system ATP-binding protein